MAKRYVAYHEAVYEHLARAEARRYHEPVEMRSGNSRGPVKMFVCDMPNCGGIAYVYGEKPGLPVCLGGAMWSFKTSFFEAGLHKEWLR